MNEEQDLIENVNENGHGIIDAGGEKRVLACLPKPESHDLPKFAAANNIIPESEWQEITLEEYILRILNQRSTSACVGHGTDGAFETEWNRAGFEPTEFSPCFIYSECNGGSDNGANVHDALQVALKGIATEKTSPWGKIFSRQIPKAAYQERTRFRMLEAMDCSTVNGMASALQKGFLVVFGIDIGGNFQPGKDGIVGPFRRSRAGYQGHCMYAVGMKKINGKWYFICPNSWSEDFGKNGICYIPFEYFDVRDLDAWAIRAANPDPESTLMPEPIATVNDSHF